jgi:hypothetical protein
LSFGLGYETNIAKNDTQRSFYLDEKPQENEGTSLLSAISINLHFFDFGD